MWRGDAHQRRTGRRPTAAAAVTYDAIAGAAKYLLSAGVATDPSAAIFAYNHLQSYVESVLYYAGAYAGGNFIFDEILPEAFATVRAAAKRLCGTTAQVTGHGQTWDMVHYDVQLIGGIQLHLGKIAEMATGEGKTLVATLPPLFGARA